MKISSKFINADLSTSTNEISRIKPAIRLIVNSKCNFNCSFPTDQGKNNRKWCHAEGIEGFTPFPKFHFHPPDPEISDILQVSKNLRKFTGFNKVRIAGLEPTLRPDIVKLVENLKKQGFKDVGITTNGSQLSSLAGDLFDAGLDEVNVSLHSLDPDVFEKITGKNCLDDVINGIIKCKEIGIPEVKVNCVLLGRKGMESEVRKFLDFAARNSLSLRFYQLFWTPLDDSFYQNYHLSWKYYFHLWKPFVSRIIIDSTTLPMRGRITFHLTTGAIVQVDTFDTPKISNPDCRACPYKFQCEEGLLGCGLRITPDLMLSPCLYREDLNIDLHNLVKLKEPWDINGSDSEFIRKMHDWNLTLPGEKGYLALNEGKGDRFDTLCVT
jgi:GTP 3',8-cyclase